MVNSRYLGERWSAECGIPLPPGATRGPLQTCRRPPERCNSADYPKAKSFLGRLAASRFRHRDEVIDHPDNLQNALWLKITKESMVGAVAHEAEHASEQVMRPSCSAVAYGEALCRRTKDKCSKFLSDGSRRCIRQ